MLELCVTSMVYVLSHLFSTHSLSLDFSASGGNGYNTSKVTRSQNPSERVDVIFSEVNVYIVAVTVR